MPDINQLETALRNADAAGDVQAARILATEIRRQQSTPQAATTPAAAPISRFDATAKVAGKTQAAFGPAEAGMQLLTSAVAAPLAGLAGIASTPFTKNPGDVVRGVQSSLTYAPRSDEGKAAASIVNYPFEKLAQFGDWAGRGTADVTGSPLLGAAVNTGIQALPSIFLKGRGRSASAAESTTRVEPTISEPGVPPEVARAKNYASTTLGLDWNSLSDAVRQRITSIAKDSTTLQGLNPDAVARQARLESLPVPVKTTAGKLTRDPVQMRNESNAAATEAGRPIRQMDVAANKALLENLNVLKERVRGQGETRGVSESPEQVGSSIQDAARLKLSKKKAEVSSLYKTAEAAGEMQGNVSTRALIKLINETPDKVHLGYVDSWLNKLDVAPETGQQSKGKRLAISLKEMEDLRQSAVARAMNGGTDGYYAGKVIRAIDEATEGAGGAAYKDARKARREQAMEFEDSSGMSKLVDDKSRTDRAVALEDTWRKTVLGGSIQDLRNVKKSLLTGPDQATRIAGRTAWRDLRAQTIQHITDEATKSVAKFEDGSPNVTPAAMERAIKSVGPQKLEEIFGPGTVRRLNQIMEATRDIKTEPPPSFKGSPTFANAIAFLEKGLGKLPLVGDVASGTITAARKLNEYGAATREVSAAKQTPLDTGVKQAAKSPGRRRNRNALKQSVPLAASSQGNALRDY